MFTSSNLATSDGLIFTVGLSLLIPLSVRPAMTSSEIVYRNHSNRCASGSFWYIQWRPASEAQASFAAQTAEHRNTPALQFRILGSDQLTP